VGCAVPSLPTRRRKAKPRAAKTTHLRESGTAVCWWARVLGANFLLLLTVFIISLIAYINSSTNDEPFIIIEMIISTTPVHIINYLFHRK